MVETYEIPDELLARCAGRADVVQRVVAAFIQQLANDVPQVTEALRAGNCDVAAKVAHRIKGASANVVAEELRQDAACLERLAQEPQLKSVANQLDKLKSDWQHYVELTSPFISQSCG